MNTPSFNKTIFGILLVSTILAIGMAYYKFYIKKDYVFMVESSCDPLYEECSERDCEEDGCPPNGLSIYKTYEINAKDFDSCLDDSCQHECENGLIQCRAVQE